MKKILRSIALIVSVVIIGMAFLNINVTTRQGVNYVVYTKKIPLYLKILDFYDRHYNYAWLVGRVVGAQKDKAKKTMQLLKWTTENIAKQPKELKVIDDHVWHIIVRGYGVDDQLQDVFCTLCNYAGVDAFFDKVRGDNRITTLSFVRLNGEWHVFDAASGTYFLNKDGGIASIKDLSEKDWHPVNIKENAATGDYQDFFNNLIHIDYDNWKYSRSSLQTPLTRLIFGFRKDRLAKTKD